MTIGVYRFTCTKNGSFYIGSAANLHKRKLRHLRDLRNGVHINVYFQRVFNKYGEASLKFEVIRTDSIEDARALEQDKLNRHHGSKLCMNIGRDATGGDNLTNNPDRAAIIRRITKSVRSKFAAMTDDERRASHGRAGESNGMYGRTHTARARRKIAEANTGRHFNKGVPKSAEHRSKMSENAKLRVGESNSFYGKAHSEATKRKLRKAAKARYADGFVHVQAIRVKIGRRVFSSSGEAAAFAGCCAATVMNRVRSDKYPEYKLA